MANAGKKLSGAEIAKIVPGATIRIDTPIGTTVPFRYNPDGKLSGEAGAVAFFLGASRDTGRWWIDGSKLCHHWKIWFKAKPRCIWVRKTGRRVAWRSDDGETGTATIVPRKQVVANKRKQGALPSGLGGGELKPARGSVTATGGGAAARARVARRETDTQPMPTPVLPTRNSLAPVPATRPPEPVRAVAVVTVAKPRPRVAQRPSTPVKRAATPDTQARVYASSRDMYRVVGVARNDVLNVRSAPSPDANVVSRLAPNATGVHLRGSCQGFWCPIRVGGKSGWVNHAYIERITKRRVAQRQTAERRLSRAGSAAFAYRVSGVRNNDVLNLRSDASQYAFVVGTIGPNARGLRITGSCRSFWCPIVHRGRSGWVNRAYLEMETISTRR